MLGISTVYRDCPLKRSSKVGQAVSGAGNSKSLPIDCTLCSLDAGRVSKDAFFDPEPVAEEIDEPPSIQIEDIRAPSPDDETNSQVLPDDIQGPETLQARTRDLVNRFFKVFSKTVRWNSAKVTPMELVVNYEDFKVPANKRAPRPQSIAKMVALREFITELLRLGVIKISREATVSQVLLVQKQGGKFLRFCIDYRELNKHTTTEGGVIPNIHEMLRRLGDKRSKYFAVMDLTQGYYQAPLSPESQKHTAFTTFMGYMNGLGFPWDLRTLSHIFNRLCRPKCWLV